MVDLAVVHLEFQTNKIWKDGGRARLCSDRGNLLAWLGPNDCESDGECVSACSVTEFEDWLIQGVAEGW